ncbi:universal stress protein [Rhodosalinus sp. 5P4]|uniref:universal stress protein n=1 Tax=Rhodosalinus sp. 5P4 TaxID=3239196 RepID=UPI003523A303
MSYKTLMTVVTDTGVSKPPLEASVALAQAWDAHLEAMCMGVDRTQTGYYYAGANAMILQETIARAQRDAEAAGQHVRDTLGKSDVRWNVETGVAQLADIGRQVAMHARFSDLVILPKPYGEDRGAELEPVIEGALFDGHVPVLVVPEDGLAKTRPERILLGWDEGDEALSAARAALPFLSAADTVHIVVVDPPAHGPNRSDPGGLLSQFLARHGVKVEIDVLSKTMPQISDVLMRHALDVDADMIVMGAYGHSRFREAILGGATRNMLENSPLPLFMAH